MKYAILSDSHDNYYNITKAIEWIKKEGITQAVHLGDFCAPPIFDILTQAEDIHWTCVWGNVDGARAQIILRLRDKKNIEIGSESFTELQTEKGKVFLTHFPLLAKNAAKSGEYVASFYGDDHLRSTEMLSNGVLLANPGEIAGTRTGQPTFGVWDSDMNDFEIIELMDFKIGK